MNRNGPKLLLIFSKYIWAMSVTEKDSWDLLKQLHNELDQLPNEMEVLFLQFPWLKNKIEKDLANRLTTSNA